MSEIEIVLQAIEQIESERGPIHDDPMLENVVAGYVARAVLADFAEQR